MNWFKKLNWKEKTNYLMVFSVSILLVVFGDFQSENLGPKLWLVVGIVGIVICVFLPLYWPREDDRQLAKGISIKWFRAAEEEVKTSYVFWFVSSILAIILNVDELGDPRPTAIFSLGILGLISWAWFTFQWSYDDGETERF